MTKDEQWIEEEMKRLQHDTELLRQMGRPGLWVSAPKITGEEVLCYNRGEEADFLDAFPVAVEAGLTPKHLDAFAELTIPGTKVAVVLGRGDAFGAALYQSIDAETARMDRSYPGMQHGGAAAFIANCTKIPREEPSPPGSASTRIKVTPTNREVVERMAEVMGLSMSKVFDLAVMEKARRDGYLG